MNSIVISCGLLAVVVMSCIDMSWGECCHVPLKCEESSRSVERCYDCTEATTYCGVGKCNVFGCNCDGGCRKGDSSLWCWNIASGCKGKLFREKVLSITNESRSSSDVKQLIAELDTDSDGKVSYEEAHRYLTKIASNGLNIKEEFNKMDTNGDGFLSAQEIDG